MSNQTSNNDGASFRKWVPFLSLWFVCTLCPASPPNIVLIVADDLGYGDLGCYGGVAKTPHLDQMAREGLRFTDFHSNGSVCSPTRASLMTGRYPHRLGIEDALPIDWDDNGIGAERNRHEITVATRLRQAGYATGIFGKWHLGKHADSNPTRHGFDEFRGLTCGCGDYFAKLDRAGYEDWWHNDQKVPEGGYVTKVLTDHATRFITENQEWPFFLYLPHLAIHFPWQGPNDEDLGVRLKGQSFTSNAPGPGSKLGPHSPAEIPSVVIQMIEELDASVGQVMGTLKQLGLDKTTLVFFTSDNGGYVSYAKAYTHGISNNGPLRGQKGDVYEGGHRVAAIAHWPGKIPAGQVSTTTAMSMDLMPTFLELAKLPTPESTGPNAMDGISLVPILFEGQSLPERSVFWRNGSKHYRAVRRGPWKLVVPANKKPVELYQVDDDLSEKHDLSTEQPEQVKRLMADLLLWENSLPLPLSGKNEP